jgi:hypothetical protein
MTNIRLGLIATLLILLPTPALAQGRLNLDVLPGVSFATERLATSDLSVGPGAEVGLSVRVMPHLFAYGAWDWRHFEAGTLIAGGEVDLEETGYAFGVRFEHPFGQSPFPALMVRAGGTYNHLEFEDADGESIGDSGHGFGWEAGAGLVFRLSDQWRVTPAARFRSLSRDLDLGGLPVDVTLRYVTVELGFSRTF